MDDNFQKTFLNRLNKRVNLIKFFKEFKKSLKNEQKNLIFQRKGRQEEKEYFDFLKFIFSSPDKVQNNK